MDSEDSTGEVLTAKIVTMVVLFAASMLTGCLPLLISLKWDWFTKGDGDLKTNNKLVVALLAFGGGVLFATAFIHLLPEVDDNIDLLVESGQMPEYDIFLAGIIVCSGFFMMYIIEELVHAYIKRREKKNESKETFSTGARISRRISAAVSLKGQDDNKEKNIEENNAGNYNNEPKFEETESTDSLVAALRGLLIVLALSIHELFEGLAVGLESNVSNVWYMFAAVSAHKYIIAFCIGVEFLASKTKTWLSILYIFTFSFVSALGIGVGILLVGGSGATEAGITSVVLQGIACGTLIYVVFFEIWGKEKAGIPQFFYSLLGFGLMTALEIVLEH